MLRTYLCKISSQIEIKYLRFVVTYVFREFFEDYAAVKERIRLPILVRIKNLKCLEA